MVWTRFYNFIILGFWYLKAKSTKLSITDNELVFEQGLLSKTRTEFGLKSIRTIKAKQSFSNRMFGTGNISIFTAGDKPEVEAFGLPNPHKARDIIKDNQNTIAA